MKKPSNLNAHILKHHCIRKELSSLLKELDIYHEPDRIEKIEKIQERIDELRKEIYDSVVELINSFKSQHLN